MGGGSVVVWEETGAGTDGLDVPGDYWRFNECYRVAIVNPPVLCYPLRCFTIPYHTLLLHTRLHYRMNAWPSSLDGLVSFPGLCPKPQQAPEPKLLPQAGT